MFQTDAKVTNVATGATGSSATSDGQSSTAHPQRFLGVSLTGGSDTATAIIYDANSASAGSARVVVEYVQANNLTAN